MTRIYTKTGDGGSTSLFDGRRVPKDHLRLHVYGTLDECNTVIGLARAHNANLFLEQLCSRLQTLLFILCSDLATPLPAPGAPDLVDRVDSRHVRYLETGIDRLTAELAPLGKFILPGGCPASAFLHQARTVCRRAERFLIELQAQEKLGPHVPILVNRLSDYLFTLARYANHVSGRPDEVLDRSFPELTAPPPPE